MTTGNLVLIDGDIICYRVAFSCQKKDENGNQVFEHEGIARARCNTMIEEILYNTSATDCMGFLTDGKENFRNKVAVTQPYKGGRLVEKPKHYDFLRYHLEHVHKYEMCTTQEADDAIGITHMDLTDGNIDAPVVIASIDKDLLMIPGRHYHISTKVSAVYDINESMKKFFLQVLTGDRTDNIMGLKGIGPVKAGKIMYNTMEYDSMFSSMAMSYKERDEYARLDETAELLWIRRVAGISFSWKHVKEVYQMYKHGGTK